MTASYRDFQVIDDSYESGILSYRITFSNGNSTFNEMYYFVHIGTINPSRRFQFTEGNQTVNMFDSSITYTLSTIYSRMATFNNLILH